MHAFTLRLTWSSESPDGTKKWSLRDEPDTSDEESH
jgi:hypothetical protein